MTLTRIPRFFCREAALFLLADTSARSTDLTTRQRLRQKVTLSNAVGASDLGNLGGQAFLRVLKSVEAVDASEGPEEERGLNGLSGWTKLNNLRKAERIKEIKEALAIAKVQVKVAAEAAAKAAAKAKEVKRIADQLDDVTVENMLKDPVFKDSVFKAWHKDNIHPQLVFDSLLYLESTQPPGGQDRRSIYCLCHEDGDGCC
ncbi:hypothetical protein GQ600_4048 [Phytophthora cactorum]|nr:hypothetical protein GQ600_4048 [Phytophthora cactorum]